MMKKAPSTPLRVSASAPRSPSSSPRREEADSPAGRIPSYKVLQVTPALDDGGAQKSAVEMALYLHQTRDFPGVRWESAVTSAGGPMEADLLTAGVPHFPLPLLSRWPWTLVGNAVRMAFLIRREKVDILHARSRAPAWSAWLASRLVNALAGHFGFQPVAFIATYHGLYGTQGPFKKFYNSVMLRGPLVIANSDFIRTHLIETYGVEPSRIAVAPRGIEPDQFDPALYPDADVARLRTELGLQPTEPLLLMVGRLARWKGQDVFLRALTHIRDLPWKAVFVGGPDKRGVFAAELTALVKTLGLTDRVVFTGSRPDTPLLNKAATLALSCSTKPEAFGRVAIEAQAMGTPVIASALGGSLETVKDNVTGWLVPPDAPHPLAEKLREALTNTPRLSTMGHHARAWALDRFTVQACCRAEASALIRLLALLGR